MFLRFRFSSNLMFWVQGVGVFDGQQMRAGFVPCGSTAVSFFHPHCSLPIPSADSSHAHLPPLILRVSTRTHENIFCTAVPSP
ncbi:hypothetical protein Hypma_007045 [Hypsizygus marmoreus]|uniref:Secreted protein n=1 Tax=Hypsizygus marmoreus TaxID=39966 RepID=A0A369K8Q5_HYPMA|nr:hypothetical protein Hypma_007045 [Hypsizygus marmoreus]